MKINAKQAREIANQNSLAVNKFYEKVYNSSCQGKPSTTFGSFYNKDEADSVINVVKDEGWSKINSQPAGFDDRFEIYVEWGKDVTD